MPQVDVVAHIVEPGDTLSGIARRYGADVKQVVQANSGYLVGARPRSASDPITGYARRP